MVKNDSMKKYINSMSSWPIPFVFCALFLILRLPALHMPYHQDEYKWAMAVGFEDFFSASIPHPPLTRFLYLTLSLLIGNDYLRLMPIIVSLITLWILFSYANRFYSKRVAVIASTFFVLMPYSVLGSLQIDIDGAVLPLFTIITVYGYFLWKESGFKNLDKLAIVILGLLGGFLSKLSFVIVPVSLAVHWLYERYFADFKISEVVTFIRLRYLWFIALLGALPVLFWLSNHVFLFRYVKNFMHVGGRNYFELFFLTAKAIIYLSPVLVILPLIGIKKWKGVSFWYLFGIISILFYAVIFDFSHRTLDRYWAVMVLPLIMISSVYLSEFIKSISKKDCVILGVSTILITLSGMFIFGLKHLVLPLNPKADFIHALITLKWNILIPISGGSGPVGFYLSLLGIVFFWALTVIAFVLLIKSRREGALAVLAIFLSYSLIVNAEYLFGYFYGSSTQVLNTLVGEVRDNKGVVKVMDYNDSGAYELIQMGKYYQRFYADPAFVESNKQKFDNFNGYFMVLDFPMIDKNSYYSQYLSNCKVEYQSSDKYIKGYIYNCTN